MILRPGQRGHRALLREAGRVAGAVALNGVNGLGDRFGSGEEAKRQPVMLQAFAKPCTMMVWS
jgi:hypothetical protein